jgi:hypothetical protein
LAKRRRPSVFGDCGYDHRDGEDSNSGEDMRMLMVETDIMADIVTTNPQKRDQNVHRSD